MVGSNELIAVITRYPFRVLLINLLLMLLIAAGVNRLGVNSGIEIFFAKDDPYLLAEQQLKRTYGREDNIFFVLDAGTGDLFTAKNLATIEAITDKAWQLPHARRVDSLTNYLHPRVDGDDITINPLIENASALSQSERLKAKAVAITDAALLGRLVNRDASVAGINVTLQLPDTDSAAAIAASVSAAREIASQAMAENPAIAIHHSGWAVTEQTLAEVTGKDGATLMPVLFTLVLLMLAILLRSTSAVFATLIVIALSIALGMGSAGWLGISLNSVNISAPTIILTLAIADCIHVFTSFLKRLRQGGDKRSALSHAMAHTLYPITLTSVTTALGFLSMNFSESPPFRELGTIAAIGVLGALWITVTILPGLIMALPFKVNETGKTGLPMEGLARFVIKRHSGVFWVSLAAIVLSAIGLTRIELNDDPAGYFSSEVPLHGALELIETKLSGTQTLHFSLPAAGVDGITEPEYLSQVDDFVQWLQNQPEVKNVEAFTQTLKRLNQVMHADDSQWHRLPDSREMAAQYTLLYEISVPFGQDVTHQVSADKSSLKVSAILSNQQSQGLLAFEERAQHWLGSNTPDIQVPASGASISFAHVGLRNIVSMLAGSALAIGLICLALMIAFRSVRFGLVSFIPNLFPALVTLGLWGAFVGEINIAASVVFSLTLGIIVDDTTHFLVKYIEGRRQLKLSAQESILHTFNTVGSALVSTSIVLAIGFLALVQSDFSVNSTSGLLVAITITVAIVLDLLFLPAVLLKIDRFLVGNAP